MIKRLPEMECIGFQCLQPYRLMNQPYLPSIRQCQIRSESGVCDAIHPHIQGATCHRTRIFDHECIVLNQANTTSMHSLFFKVAISQNRWSTSWCGWKGACICQAAWYKVAERAITKICRLPFENSNASPHKAVPKFKSLHDLPIRGGTWTLLDHVRKK